MITSIQTTKKRQTTKNKTKNQEEHNLKHSFRSLESSMLSDPQKLFLLAICTIGCLSTLFTSASIRMGNSSMGVMTPRNHCMNSKKAVNQCKTQGKAPCNTLEVAASKCQKAVKEAYRHINLGGCPFEIKSLTLCEAEWCRSSSSSFQQCEKECSMVRKNLDTCIESQVSNYFLKNGLEKDGTIQEKK